MTTILTHAEPGQKIVLRNISWDLYERILKANHDRRVPRFTCDKGQLEIMSPSDQHEQLIDAIRHLIQLVAEELRINLKGFGSTTFRRWDIRRGFEPDACFYSKNLGRVFGKRSKLDLRTDPPPDLVIEIDIGASSLDKEAIMEQFGVPELWRYRRRSWRILVLGPNGYEERPQSSILPGLTAKVLSTLMQQSRVLEPLAWNRFIRKAAREMKA